MIKDINCTVIGLGKKNGPLEASKFFFVDPDTGEMSQMYDTADAAEAAAEAVMRRRDETGYTIYISQVVRVISSERAFKKIECVSGGKR